MPAGVPQRRVRGGTGLGVGDPVPGVRPCRARSRPRCGVRFPAPTWLRRHTRRIGYLPGHRRTFGRPRHAGCPTQADVAAAYLSNAESREEAEATSVRFQHGALHDALTGPGAAPGTRWARCSARSAVPRCRGSPVRRYRPLQHVNDSHGHHVGDKGLIAVAQRLSRIARSGDTLSRVSGDDFGALV
jgi:uncharacterized C2H2 Zn-finger protein